MSHAHQKGTLRRSAAAADLAWSPSLRGAVSVLLGLHLAAVFVAPWSSPPPSSDLAQVCARWFAPYLNLFFLNHGYRFFAPNPGPSHLVRYELELPDGTTKEGRFPDADSHWPRLLYHRHFMISETVFNITEPFARPPEEGFVSTAQRRAFEREKENAQILVRSLARYLIRQHGARRARLFIQVHLIPAPRELAEAVDLGDQGLYPERLLGEVDSDGGQP
jgi:hypothetical protein